MKKLLVILLISLGGNLSAQIFNTGSATLDADLKTINTEAKTDSKKFKADLSISYDIPIKRIEGVQIKAKLEPAEVLLALEIGKITKRSLEDVVEVYQRDRGKGWGEVAKQLGIKPGSPEFHALKGTVKGKKDKKTGPPANKGKRPAKAEPLKAKPVKPVPGTKSPKGKGK